MESCRKQLITGLESLHTALTEEQIEQLLNFVKLIEKWNKAYNLTAIRSTFDMISMHLLDSLAVLPYIKGPRIVDIGTGAGLPGLPLAISSPDLAFTLLDSNAKKTRFVQQAVIELKLKNVEVHLGRAENYHPKTLFDTVLTRAFAGLSEIVKSSAHLLDKEGILLAMKGQRPDTELMKLSDKATLIPLEIPGVEAERCLVKLQSQAIIEGMAWEK